MFIDFTRVSEAENAVQQQLNAMRKFHADRISKLNLHSAKIEAFLEKFHGYDMRVSNMYSSGIDARSMYSEQAGLLVTLDFTVDKRYSNLKLLVKRMEEHWRLTVGSEISICRLYEHSFKLTAGGFDVSLQIRIN